MTPLSVTPADVRKGELRKLRMTNRRIAKRTQVPVQLVCHIIAGRRLNFTGADKVMAYVAKLLHLDVDSCFPELRG